MGVSMSSEVTFAGDASYRHWHIRNVVASYERLISLGSGTHGTPTAEAGGGGGGGGESRLGIAPLLIDRRLFYEVFNDMTVIVDGGFLNLPMEHFKIYDVAGNNVVLASEVYLVLTLMCRGVQEEKIAFGFTLFDYDRSGSICLAELQILLQSLVQGMCKVGCVLRLRDNSVEEVVGGGKGRRASAGKRHNSRGRAMRSGSHRGGGGRGGGGRAAAVPAAPQQARRRTAVAKYAEIRQRRRTQVGRRGGGRTDGGNNKPPASSACSADDAAPKKTRNNDHHHSNGATTKKKASSPGGDSDAVLLERVAKQAFAIADRNHDGDISAMEFLSWACVHTHSLGALTAVLELHAPNNVAEALPHPAVFGGGHHQHHDAKRFSKTGAECGAIPTRPEQPRQESNRPSKMNRNEMRQHKKNELARHHLVARNATLLDLVHATNFQIHDLAQLRTEFSDYCAGGARIASHTRMTESVFRQILVSKFPSVANDPDVFNRTFAIFDTNGDGYVDFSEFTVNLSKLVTGSISEKLELLFSFYDRDGDGTMSMLELAAVVKGTGEQMRQIAAYSDDVIASIDLDGDGKITEIEFRVALEQQKMLLECFMDALPLASTFVGGNVRELRDIQEEQFQAAFESGEEPLHGPFVLAMLFGSPGRPGMWEEVGLGLLMHAQDVAFPQFAGYMQTYCGFGDGSGGKGKYKRHLLSLIFSQCDVEMQGAVNFKELLVSIAKPLCRDVEEQISLVAHCIRHEQITVNLEQEAQLEDHARNGSVRNIDLVDRPLEQQQQQQQQQQQHSDSFGLILAQDVIQRFLTYKLDAFEADGNETLALLQETDRNNDGSVNIDELRETISQNPTLARCFAHVFRAGDEPQLAPGSMKKDDGGEEEDNGADTVHPAVLEIMNDDRASMAGNRALLQPRTGKSK